MKSINVTILYIIFITYIDYVHFEKLAYIMKDSTYQ